MTWGCHHSHHSLAQQKPLSFSSFVLRLTWISAGTVLVSGQIVAFLPRLEVLDLLLKSYCGGSPRSGQLLKLRYLLPLACLASDAGPPYSMDHLTFALHTSSSACFLTVTLVL